MSGRTGPARTATRRMLRVPEITVYFWIIKGLSTAMGESTSDYLVHSSLGPVPAVGLGFAGFLLALALQFSRHRYIAWAYWLAVVMVGVFGTMAADVLHVGFGVPYYASSTLYAVMLIAVFVTWQRTEKTLSIHSIDTPRREAFYWAAVVATFALGTAAGDMTAVTFHLGYFYSMVLFAGIICVPAIGYRWMNWNPVFSFWFAYVITRPLGASFADWVGKPTSLSGLGVGDGTVALVLTCAIACLVGYLSITRRDVQGDPAHGRDPTRIRTDSPSPTGTGSPARGSPSSPAGPVSSTAVARVSPAISRWCARIACCAAGLPAMTRLIRSDTARPASRRACCTARTTSRARPSAASGAVTAVSSTMNPPPGSTAVAPAPSASDRLDRELTRAELDAAAGHHAGRGHRPVAGLARPDRGLHAFAEPRAGEPRVDGEPPGHADPLRLGVGRVEQRHLAHVDLVGDQPGEVRQRVGIGGHHRQLRQRQPHAQPAGLAQRRRGRAHLADLVHRGRPAPASAGRSATSGQSARCTDRPPVRPRQISSVTSGSSGAVARQTISSDGVEGVERMPGRRLGGAGGTQNRSRERRMYQFVSTSRNARAVSQALATS